MKRYVLALALMVLCAAALIVAVAYYRPCLLYTSDAADE